MTPGQRRRCRRTWKQAWAHSRSTLRVPAPFKISSFSAPRARPNTPPTRTNGIPSAVPKVDRVVCCLWRRRTLVLQHCSPVRSTGSRTRRPTRSADQGQGLRDQANAQPHVWPWHFSFAEFASVDKRLRHAANLPQPGGSQGSSQRYDEVPKGTVPPATVVGQPKFDIKYDLAAAKS